MQPMKFLVCAGLFLREYLFFVITSRCSSFLLCDLSEVLLHICFLEYIYYWSHRAPHVYFMWKSQNCKSKLSFFLLRFKWICCIFLESDVQKHLHTHTHTQMYMFIQNDAEHWQVIGCFAIVNVTLKRCFELL